MSGINCKTRLIDFTANALVLQKNKIKNGRYRFRNPSNRSDICTLEIMDCSGIQVSVIKNEKKIASKKLANKENLILTTLYWLSCRLKIPKDAKLPPQDPRSDWPRSTDGRNRMQDAFLEKVNYFLDNLMYLSSQSNPDHFHLSNVRPIGGADLISIDFYLGGDCVASQGNVLLGWVFSRREKAPCWPQNSHITRRFTSVPAEHKLLTRACSLVNFGFYQEAILIAFSVLDAKVKELIKKRIEVELSISKSKTNEYLMRITHGRLDTLLNFILKILDKTSRKSEVKNLFGELETINKKRNKIIHDNEPATRGESVNAIITIAKLLEHLNNTHKGEFNIPQQLLNDSKSWLLFE